MHEVIMFVYPALPYLLRNVISVLFILEYVSISPMATLLPYIFPASTTISGDKTFRFNWQTEFYRPKLRNSMINLPHTKFHLSKIQGPVLFMQDKRVNAPINKPFPPI